MKIILTTLLLTFCTVLNFAGDGSRKGTNGAEQLLIPVGARGIATGGAFLSNLTGLESIYYNPGGLDLATGAEAMFSYMSYIANINVSYFAVSSHLGDLGSFAFTFKTLDFGDIPVTTFENPDGTGATFKPTNIVGGLTYSKRVTDKVSAGVTVKIIHESIENTNATGFAMDFGVQYRFPSHLSIGAAVKNIGSNMSFDGTSLQQKTKVPGTSVGSGGGLFTPVTEEFQIPSYFELSTSYQYDFNEQNNIILASTFRNNNVAEDLISFGLEYGYLNTFFLRGGYTLQVVDNSESIYGFTAGAGLNYTFTGGVTVTFDYAYRDVEAPFDANHVFTVKLGIQ